MDTLDSKKTQKNASENYKYFCYGCSYGSMNKTDYLRHCSTKKHTMDSNDAKKTQKNAAAKFMCDCGSVYKYRQGLSKHRKTCEKKEIATPITDVSNNVLSNEFILEFMKQEKEFKVMFLETVKQGFGNNSHNTNTNSHNKTKFNMNFFLNEQCKDAMNIMDFVNTLQLNLRDLERVGEQGYVKGISHIIVNNLKDLDVHKRPVHCSDVKRETMYVKDEDAWAKDEAKKKLSKMITHVAHKNQKQIGEWKDENPEHTNSESTKSEQFLKIVGESMNGLTNDEESDGYTNKIIKTIATNVVIKEEE